MTEEKPKEVCGIIMPIGGTAQYPESHWVDVREIIEEAIDAAGFAPNLVSDASDVGIIQKRIIQNLYENPIVVCDVSSKNPNVMFELGLRLAFDKPTIIIKDSQTDYSFDTSPIEHLGYPSDLRFNKIVEFKKTLATKIQGTYEKATKDKGYTTFLKHFGPFKVAKIETEEVSGQEYILDKLGEIGKAVNRLEANATNQRVPRNADVRMAPRLDVKYGGNYRPSEVQKILSTLPDVSEIETNLGEASAKFHPLPTARLLEIVRDLKRKHPKLKASITLAGIEVAIPD